MLIIPAIDLRNGRCVRLTQGRKDSTKIYDGDPVEIAKSYEASGAEMIHVVDLDGAFSDSNSRNRQVLAAITRATDAQVQFGGGFRTRKDVRDVTKLGVTRVVLGTMAVESPEALKTVMVHFRHQIAVGIDAKAGRVVTRGREKQEQLTPLNLAVKVAALGIERIVYTDVGRGGMFTSVDIDSALVIARSTGLKVTVSGGVSSLEELKQLKVVSGPGIDSVIVGKALYEGRFTLAEALRTVESAD
jgi:phosphoribosylformimino-5-aminoimidazole carboxamide ribotide isomerase